MIKPVDQVFRESTERHETVPHGRKQKRPRRSGGFILPRRMRIKDAAELLDPDFEDLF